MKGIEELSKDFFENHNVCTEPKNLQIGQEVYVIDPELMDEENDFYAFIPCVVLGMDVSALVPGRVYYYFRAEGSKMDDVLNKYPKALDNGGRVFYYKYLENTSPYIFTVTKLHDFTNNKDEP